MANPGRLDVDWLAVRLDYETGQLSNRAIAAKHRVSHEAVRKRAKANGWSHSLSGAVARASAVAFRASGGRDDRIVEDRPRVLAVSALPEPAVAEAVQVAATTQVQVVRQHRTGLAKDRDKLDKLAALLDEQIQRAAPAGLRQLAEAADVLERLIRCRERVIRMERTAFGVDKLAEPSGTPPVQLSEEQKEALRAAIFARVRQQIEREQEAERQLSARNSNGGRVGSYASA